MKWLFFEPLLLDRFSKTLDRKNAVKWFFNTYLLIILLSIILFTFYIFIAIILDLPHNYQELFPDSLILKWDKANNYTEKFFSFFKHGFRVLPYSLLSGLFFGLAGTFVVSLGAGLIISLIIDLIIGFLISYSGGLVPVLTGALTTGVVLGIGSGIVLFMILNLIDGSISGFKIGLVGGLGGCLFVAFLMLGLGGTLEGGLQASLFFFLSYFRIYMYPIYLLSIFQSVNLKQNPYINDSIIWLPIPFLKSRLAESAYEDPDSAFEFVDFLLEYRPLQRSFAMHISHSATAGQWDKNVLKADALIIPQIAVKQEKFLPSQNWTAKIEAIKAQLVASQKENNIGIRKKSFEDFMRLLKELRDLTLRESPLWNKYYLPAIEKWLDVAIGELESLKLKLQSAMPITANVYRSGDALNPKSDSRVFMERDDVKDEFITKVMTAVAMPMFLIRGQRRVGKTSLLNFLPERLGARFKIVKFDMQGLIEHTVSGWFSELRGAINKELSLPPDNYKAPEQWLKACSELKEFLEHVSKEKDYKLVIAFDEYEDIHKLISKDPEQGAQLLGAMRSFSQSQNYVVFLFAGTRLFSELRDPNWNEYFVQTVTLKVDYLKYDEAIKLITKPVEDFNLKYPPELANHMYEITQGHPALLQAICSEMVDIANRALNGNMTFANLDEALAKSIDRSTHAMSVFWSQFCTDSDKETVLKIIKGNPPSDKVSIARLLEHGFIAKDGDKLKMRVPLFELWLKEYAETFF
ncbi:MAG: ATP-binding protein [Nitrospirae bacterium]|nr:ATP-binding protein [Nitrospirota bacterium]MBF0535391.1 ATP-binding protein [Nitrospirota bacterium]MBF0616911.1 ATP-binding protein [Nitrospirota bacterium]